MKYFTKFSKVTGFIVVLTLFMAGIVRAATTIDLGTAEDFAVLGGSTVTNTGTSVLTGNLGVSPGSAITGFPPGTVTGTTHAADAVALQAQNDLVIAYNNAADQASTTDLTGLNLGGRTLTAGVYTFSSSAQLTGSLTLDAENDPNAVFIFQIGSTLTTASSSSVVLANEAQSCHVFWQVGSSATLGSGTEFIGTIMALTSATLNTDANVDGRVLARNGAVTLDSNNITVPVCAVATTASLHIIKHVENDSGRTSSAADFNLHVTLSGIDVTDSPADGAEYPGTLYTLPAGNYVVSEDANALYTKTFGEDCDSEGRVTLALGDNKTCIITNNDTAIVPATLHVIKHVENDSGRTSSAADFNLHVTLSGIDVTDSPADGAEYPGTLYTLSPGTYVVNEDANALYTKTFSGGCNSSGSITLSEGANETCTITNNDTALVPATLRVVKTVVNDEDGNATASNFTMHVRLAGADVAGSPTVGAVTPGTSYSLPVGTYVVSEDIERSHAHYTQTFSGACDTNGSVTLTEGDNEICTITNNDYVGTTRHDDSGDNHDDSRDSHDDGNDNLTDTSAAGAVAAPGFPNAGFGPDYQSTSTSKNNCYK